LARPRSKLPSSSGPADLGLLGADDLDLGHRVQGAQLADDRREQRIVAVLTVPTRIIRVLWCSSAGRLAQAVVGLQHGQEVGQQVAGPTR